MKKYILVSLFFLISLAVTEAQVNQSTNQLVSAFAFEQLTISTTAVIFTVATYAPTVTNAPASTSRATLATFECDNNAQAAPGNQIRIRWDGTAPTSSVGITLNPNVEKDIYGYTNISQFKMIRAGGTDVVCNVHYYRTVGNAQ